MAARGRKGKGADEAFRPIARVALEFRDTAAFAHVDDPVAEDLSAAARAGDTLFLSCDETAGIDRLRPVGDGHWAAHEHYNLGDFFDLPGGAEGEMDIEGLAVDGGCLWITGSHALKRQKPERGENAAREALAEMESIGRDPNRYFLGRVPLVDGEDGLVPVAKDGKRRAACIRLKKKRSKLVEWLRGDPHLGPFLDLPSKENGLDIEGIEAEGDRVWLGLRGPVLRGHAVVIELVMDEPKTGRLKPRKLEEGRRYRLHLLPSRGAGVRDLARDGADLLVLVGPAMAGDGPAHVLRWRDAAAAETSGVRAEEVVETLIELPYRGARDHPEGLARWPEAGADAWLVVYDAPSEERLSEGGRRVAADVVRLPGNA